MLYGNSGAAIRLMKPLPKSTQRAEAVSLYSRIDWSKVDVRYMEEKSHRDYGLHAFYDGVLVGFEFWQRGVKTIRSPNGDPFFVGMAVEIFERHERERRASVGALLRQAERNAEKRRMEEQAELDRIKADLTDQH